VSKDLINDQIVTVRHFGTLSPHTRPGHKANDVSSGAVRELSDTRSVRFHPHESFLSLLLDRLDRFRDKGFPESDE
jgi:nucleoid DNA-binding protein